LILGFLLYFGEFGIPEIMLCGIIIIAGIFNINNVRLRMAGLPIEDELSKKIKIKAAALSFYLSFFLWIILMLINNFIKMDFRELINIGILGMAVLFGIFWLYFRKRGRVNE